MGYRLLGSGLVLLLTCLFSLSVPAGPPATSVEPGDAESTEAGVVREDLASTKTPWLIVVFKSTRRLYLFRDGVVVRGITVRKSELDPKFYSFLAGTEDDEMTIDFPVDVALSGLSGPRTWKFDKKTPEGTYFVCEKDDRAHTNNTVALELSYPNLEDARNALQRGRITREQYGNILARLRRSRCPVYDTYLGGYIKIHGPKDTDVVAWKKNGVDLCGSGQRAEDCRQVDFQEYLRLDRPGIGAVVPGRTTLGCVVPELGVMFYLYNSVPEGTPVVIHP